MSKVLSPHHGDESEQFNEVEEGAPLRAIKIVSDKYRLRQGIECLIYIPAELVGDPRGPFVHIDVNDLDRTILVIRDQVLWSLDERHKINIHHNLLKVS
jgi:hypothetical protein